MKIQLNIIYITLFTSIVSALIYAYCIFGWSVVQNSFADKCNNYISNIILGIWGSSIISLIIGITSYCEYRRIDMEKFMQAKQKLFRHCSKYKDKNSYEWFDEYVNIYRELSNSLSNIVFLFDPMKHRLFLKKIVDYYYDFILLTQGKYILLEQLTNDVCKKNILREIDEIVIHKRKVKQGSMYFNLEENRLISDIENTIKNVDNIYRNKGIWKKFYFSKTMLTDKNFVILNEKYEKHVKKILKKLEEENRTDILFEMPIDDAEYLMKVGYLSGYTKESKKNYTLGINCTFVLTHYFYMKNRVLGK